MLMLDSALEVGKHTVVLIMDEVAPTSSYEDQSVFVEPSTASHEFICAANRTSSTPESGILVCRCSESGRSHF